MKKILTINSVEFNTPTEKVITPELEKEICTTLEQFNMHYPMWREDDTTIAVEVTWGDWRHDHLQLDWFMRDNFDLTLVDVKITEEDGSDTYSAIRYYCK